MRRHIGILIVLFTISLTLPLMAYGHGGDTTKIHSCHNNASGEIKVVGANDSCGNNETALDWAITPDLQFTTPPTWSQTLPATERFVLVMGGVAVLDRETGLVWERSPSTYQPTFWAEALSRCYAKNLGGRLGWRPPTLEELTSLVDKTQSNPALPSGHPFSNVQSSAYWSATTSANFTSGAWVVNFGNGVPDSGFDKAGGNGLLLIWCVRGGQGYDGR